MENSTLVFMILAIAPCSFMVFMVIVLPWKGAK